MPAPAPRAGQTTALHSLVHTTAHPAWLAADAAARQSYGRLLAWLACQWRDVAAAEDALAAALEKALALWPAQGVPTAPDAWLLPVARRELLQAARRQRLHDSPQVQAVLAHLPHVGRHDGRSDVRHDGRHDGRSDGRSDSVTHEPSDEHAPLLPDSRLGLLFVCAHPAIDAAVRPALMLQAVLGLPAQQIAQAMLTSPAAMAQRLVRAKQKIRDAGLRFEPPGADELPERLPAVLEAIYAAYGLGWEAAPDASAPPDSGDGDEPRVQGLRDEAIFLADLLCSLLPASPARAEAEGLLALMLLCEARVAARQGPDGRFIPLAEQDTARWQAPLIEQGNWLLANAARWQVPGPFQLEAAIQSAHCTRRDTGATPWPGILLLYRRLLAIAPSLGAEVAHAVACAQAGELARAGALLAALDSPRLASYQPYWVARGHVAALLGQPGPARQALQRAIGLTSAPAVRAHLQVRLQALGG